jgi:hypothetical protein
LTLVLPEISISIGQNELFKRRLPPRRHQSIAEGGKAKGIFLSKRELAQTKPAENEPAAAGDRPFSSADAVGFTRS